jgi:hypothetical protein
MKASFVSILIVLGLSLGAFSHAAQSPKVGGFEQIPPDKMGGQDIGAGWGHRSMTFGMMNLMSGITGQVASILRSDKVTPDMMRGLSGILDHIAEMMNYAPAYLMGTKVVDSKMIKEMHDILKDLEKMRKEIGVH